MAFAAIAVRYVVSDAMDIQANASVTYRIAVPNVDGYRPILGFYDSNSASSNIIPYKASMILISSNNTLSLSVRNIADRVVHNVTISANIMYVKI